MSKKNKPIPPLTAQGAINVEEMKTATGSDGDFKTGAAAEVGNDLTRLALALFEEVDDLEELVDDITETKDIDGKKVVVFKPESLDSGINAIGFLRLSAKAVDAEAKRRADAAIPVDVAEELKTIAADKSGLTKRIAVAESSIVSALSVLVESGELEKSSKSENGVTLTVVYKDKVEIIDADKVPDEFLFPRAQCIDTKKLGEAMAKFAEKVEAAKTLELPEPANPFAEAAKIGKSFSFTTKVPEVVG